MEQDNAANVDDSCPAGSSRLSEHVAASSKEVGRDLLARTFLDVPVVMYRTQSGEPVALADECAHRGPPLSMGKLVGDTNSM